MIIEGLKRFGRIDSLVNNAGIFVAKPFTDYTAEDFAKVLAVNVAGFFHITQRAVAAMAKQGSRATSSASRQAWWTSRSPACRP